MSITPRGMSIQEAYRIYSEEGFLVNRKYQRKLVWTVDEKVHLIDSILSGLPIPLILLAAIESEKFEIIDGLQRLNAIFSFIENNYPHDGGFFDINQFSRAKQLASEGKFKYQTDNLLDSKKCANFLDYQLAVTTYPNSTEEIVTDIFGRINSGGKQLSNQDKRQAGMLDSFSNAVRIISSEVRGDSSQDIMLLSQMPEISIDSNRENIGYGIKAENVFWCKHGVLNKAQLRESQDEEMIVDLIASIILGEPIARSKDLFDQIYDPASNTYKELNKKLNSYGFDKLKAEMMACFSIFEEIHERAKGSPVFKSVVNPGSANPVKNSFFSFFMALFELVVIQELSPDKYDEIIRGITGLQSKISSSAHYAKPEDRIQNVNMTMGLITSCFVKKDPPILAHGPGLALDLENSIRRSRMETNRYECKQGMYDLGSSRSYNSDLLDRLLETACGIANIGPQSDGFIFIGVADDASDSERIKDLDGITPYEVMEGRFIVGVGRELSHENLTLESYINRLMNAFEESQLSEPLKSQILSQYDVVEIKGFTVIRIRVPKQRKLSFVGERAYVRQGSNTILIEGPKLIAASENFNQQTASSLSRKRSHQNIHSLESVSEPARRADSGVNL